MEVNNGEEKYIWEMIKSKLDTIGYYEKLAQKGYIEKQDIKIDPVKIVSNKYDTLSVYYYMTFYENVSNELVATFFVYDVDTDSLLKIESNIITSSGDLKSFFNYSEFNEPLERGFNVFGVEFLCATAGLIACTAYCAMIGAISVPVGVTCSLVCGTAFNAACSV